MKSDLQRGVLTPRDLTPYGIPKSVILFIFSICSIFCGQFVTASGLMTIFPSLKIYTWDEKFSIEKLVPDKAELAEMTETKVDATILEAITAHVCSVNSFANDTKKATLAVCSVGSTYITKKWMFLIVFIAFFLSFWMMFYSASTVLVDCGTIIGSVASTLFIGASSSILEIYVNDKPFALACSVLSACSDISGALPSIMVMVAGYYDFPTMSTVNFVYHHILILLLLCMMVTPHSWASYVDANMLKAKKITVEEWEERKAVSNRKETNGTFTTGENDKLATDLQNPTEVTFTKSLLNPSTIFFISFMIVHYIRLKKLMQELQPMFVHAVGNSLSMSSEEKADMMILFNTTAMLGPVFNFVLSYLFTFMSFATSLAVVNVLLMASQYLLCAGWTEMYWSAVIIGGASSMNLCLIPMFLKRFFSLSHLLSYQSLIFLIWSILGYISTKGSRYILENYYDGNVVDFNSFCMWFQCACLAPLIGLFFTEIDHNRKIAKYEAAKKKALRSITLKKIGF